ncbi:MAG: cupin domain-containing protein [Spirochaetota bacterium]
MVTESGEEKPIKAGDFAIVLPNEQHQFKNTSSTDELQFICLVPKEYE